MLVGGFLFGNTRWTVLALDLQQQSQGPSQLAGDLVAMEDALVRGISPCQKLTEDGRMASGGLPRKHSS